MTKTVRESRDIWSSDLEGPIDEVIERLQEMKREALEKGWADIRIDIYYYVDLDISLQGHRPETAEETAVREFKEAEAAKQQREVDLKELLRLQSLYKAES